MTNESERRLSLSSTAYCWLLIQYTRDRPNSGWLFRLCARSLVLRGDLHDRNIEISQPRFFWAKSSRDVDVDIIRGDCEDAREIPLHKRDKLQEFRSVVVLQRQFKAASTSLTCIASLFGPLTGFVSIRLVHLFLICQYVLTCLAHITIGLSWCIRKARSSAAPKGQFFNRADYCNDFYPSGILDRDCECRRKGADESVHRRRWESLCP